MRGYAPFVCSRRPCRRPRLPSMSLDEIWWQEGIGAVLITEIDGDATRWENMWWGPLGYRRHR